VTDHDPWPPAVVQVDAIVGETFTDVVRGDECAPLLEASGRRYDPQLILRNESRLYVFGHLQGCCETVYLEDVCGDLTDLVGSEILRAYEVSAHGETHGGDCDETWTFYHLITAKGYVTLRFLGESNGYYSTEVDLIRIEVGGGMTEGVQDPEGES